ncbi:uncharacterized protein LOC144817736 isoform X2 [Lissotriton helveticus]
MPGAVLGQGSSLKKENKMSALQVVANKSKEKADSGCESDSDSNYACEAPDFDEEVGRACSRPSGKQNYSTGLYSGKTDAGSSRFDNVVSLDSAGRPCKKRKTESLNPVNASTVNLTASKPCSATTLPNSSLVSQESKNNSVDSGSLDVCCDVHKADGEEAAHVEDNEKVTPSCSQDSIQPAVIFPCAPGRKLAVVQRSPEPRPVQVPALGPGVSEVWVVGHSYVSRLKDHFFAERYPEWARRAGFNVSFYGQEGLRLEQLRSLLEPLLAGTPTPPAAVIVHLGGNDLVHLGRKYVGDAVVTELGWLAEKFPQAVLAWSHIIPRFQWQGGVSVKGLNHSVKKLNNKLDKLCQSPKLQTISHGCIRGQRYYMQDGVHLSKEGNDLFALDLLAWLVRCTRQI